MFGGRGSLTGDLFGVGGVDVDVVVVWTGAEEGGGGGEDIIDVGVIDVQIVGWRSVAVVACGWNNVPNWAIVVLFVVGSNIGL